MTSNYIHAKNSVVIGALNSNQPNFRFIGEIKNIKLGNYLNYKSNNTIIKLPTLDIEYEKNKVVEKHKYSTIFSNKKSISGTQPKLLDK